MRLISLSLNFLLAGLLTASVVPAISTAPARADEQSEFKEKFKAGCESTNPPSSFVEDAEPVIIDAMLPVEMSISAFPTRRRMRVCTSTRKIVNWLPSCYEDEYSYVLDGTIGGRVGDHEVVAGQGSYVVEPRGPIWSSPTRGGSPRRGLRGAEGKGRRVHYRAEDHPPRRAHRLCRPRRLMRHHHVLTKFGFLAFSQLRLRPQR